MEAFAENLDRFLSVIFIDVKDTRKPFNNRPAKEGRFKLIKRK